MTTKLISWNVNGIRAALKKDFLASVQAMDPDILCLQETKAQPEQIEIDLEEYHKYWNSAEKKGYSGTALLSKTKPENVTFGMDSFPDNEGRVITADFGSYYLVNVYTPNAKRQLERLEFRMEWDKAFSTYLTKLNEEKPVLVCGDMNVAHQEIDLKNPKTNKTTKTKPGNAGFTDQERAGMTSLLNKGFIDTFRHFYPDTVKYSWWSYMFNARAKNVGWRIDYVITSRDFIDHIKDAFIHNEYYGSDHCPVGVDFRPK
jgi:exodeoxyribonuclease-3